MAKGSHCLIWNSLIWDSLTGNRLIRHHLFQAARAFLVVPFVFSALLISTLLSSPASHAELRWSGFASVGAGLTSQSDARLYGYTNHFDFEPNTLFALQAQTDISSDLSATIQFISRGEDNFNVSVAWAYLSYKLNDQVHVNAGKLRIPMFTWSDSLDVGYAYPWLNPPGSVYRAPFDEIVGASLDATTHVGDWFLSSQLVFGRYQDDIIVKMNPYTADVRNIFGGAVTAERGHWLLRASYFDAGSVSIFIDRPEVEALTDVLAAYGLNKTIDALYIDQDPGYFGGLGLKYDNQQWFGGIEYTQLAVKNSLLARQYSHYVTLGRYFNRFTLHATYGQAMDRSSYAASTIPAEPLINPPATAELPNYDSLQPLVRRFIEGEMKRYQYGIVGARYELTSQAALKLELTRLKDKAGLVDANLLTFALQTVF